MVGQVHRRTPNTGEVGTPQDEGDPEPNEHDGHWRETGADGSSNNSIARDVVIKAFAFLGVPAAATMADEACDVSFEVARKPVS
jgi:hypothetical protein